MNIGKLNKRITFLKPTTGHDEMGQEIEGAWQPFKTVWANIKPLRGREYWDAKKKSAKQNYKIITRYHDGVTNDMRIKYKEKIFNIESAADVEEEGTMLEIQCYESIEPLGDDEDG
ncbi:MAG: phage head closure protein [Clostridiales bacterium]|nr:phage head closure protein [Clostridiales bacterium]